MKTGPKPRPLQSRFWEKVDRLHPTGCWRWTASKSPNGYGKIIRGGRGTPLVPAHVVSWELAHDPVPAGLCVLHRCDNKLCVNPAHLFLGTKADNAADRDRKGRQSKGSQRWNAKITPTDVLAIRRMAADGETHQSIADHYHLCRPHVTTIVNRQRWGWLD